MSTKKGTPRQTRPTPGAPPFWDAIKPSPSKTINSLRRTYNMSKHTKRAGASSSDSSLILATRLRSGQNLSFEVDPEVAFHILQEFKKGAQQVHFEDVCEKPVTLTFRHLRSLQIDLIGIS